MTQSGEMASALDEMVVLERVAGLPCFLRERAPTAGAIRAMPH
jgi:hypothetical protein